MDNTPTFTGGAFDRAFVTPRNQLEKQAYQIYEETHFSKSFSLNWHSFDHEKVSAMAFFLTKTPISFEFDMLAVFCKLFLKDIVNTLLLRLIGGL